MHYVIIFTLTLNDPEQTLEVT